MCVGAREREASSEPEPERGQEECGAGQREK